MVYIDTIQSELCKKDLGMYFLCGKKLKLTQMLDILAKQIVAEELIVKKAGGKYKMLPLFTETTTKIKEVSEKQTPIRNENKTDKK